MNKNIWKSIGAVLAGILVGAVLSIVTDVVLHATRVFPPWDQPASNALLLFATAIARSTALREAMSQRGSRPIGPCCTP